MTSPVMKIDFSISPYDRLRAAYDLAHAATKDAWMAEVKAAQALQDSKTWKAYAPSWKAYCKDFMPYEAVTYRVYASSIPITELVETVTTVTLSEGQARAIREKINEIVPRDERSIVPSLWQLAYEYSGKIDPDKDVIGAAYRVLKEERDNNSLSVNGESFDIKQLGQKEAIREALLDNIQSHSSSSKKAKFRDLAPLLALLPSITTSDSAMPSERAKNFRLIWDEE